MRAVDHPAMRLALLAFALTSLFAGCGCDTPPSTDAPLGDGGRDTGPPRHILDTVPETDLRSLSCLTGEAVVVRTEGDVPHIYAEDRVQASCVLGFVMARDRFFQMDLTSRLSQGALSELLGDAALGTDIEQRMNGASFVADLYLASVTPEEAEELDAFAAGVNAYIQAVRDRTLPPPSELRTAAGLLGARSPADLMHDWDRRDVIATGATVLYGTSFETGDVGRARSRARGASVIAAGAPDRDLRVAGLLDEIMERIEPPNDSQSAAGWGLETAAGPAMVRSAPFHLGGTPSTVHVPDSVLEHATRHLARFVARTPRLASGGEDEGYGSNEWAVSGVGTGDGHTLLCGDGHLQLSSPALFWQFALDTRFFAEMAGGTGDRMIGATIAGLPAMGVGTNGNVAWTQTAYFADVTDWYAEEIVLAADGRPMASRFRGADQALMVVTESYEIADVPLLMSVGRTEMIQRYTTFDGRWITSIEGTPVPEGTMPPAAAVNLYGDWIVPGDTDGDGVVSAISFDYAPFDGGSLLRAFRLFSQAETVEDFRQATRHFIGYGGSMMAADSAGDVVYTAYHAVPERAHLPRNPDGSWMDGADPRLLIDGTQYGGFTIPLTADGTVDEVRAASGMPNERVVPGDDWPEALSPARGFVHHANNDPGGIATDGDLFDDPHYIGGPWIEGYRAERIESELTRLVAAGGATFEAMQALQGDHHSNLGEQFLPVLLGELDYVQALSGATGSDGRSRALYDADTAAIDDVEARLRAWQTAGLPTPSGVETFYHSPAASEAADAVATTLFHVWFSRWVRGILDDEGLDSSLSFAVTGDTFRLGVLRRLIDGRGPGNPRMLGSWDPTREESVFFDDVRTPEVELSHEIAIRALTDTLAFLRSAPTAPGEGGFGSDDPNDWIWGLRHGVHYDSLLADFLGGDPMFSFLLDMFSVTPADLPLAPDLPMTDPRFGLTFFPRPGDQFDVDAANPGLSGERFTHGSGPVFRMVIRLGPDGVRGENILPGGQSGLTSSEFFTDQAELWLANETWPMRYTPEEVVAGAVGRETYLP
jgi:penicillin amidase